MNNKFTCIIPFYNEEKILLSIIEKLKNLEYISQIICVDDGSTNGLSTEIKRLFPKVTVVKLDKNQGKADAVFAGIQKAQNENIFLTDSDQYNINIEEIENAMTTFSNNNSIDMIIFKINGNNSVIDTLLRKFIFLSGNRLMRKKDFVSIEKLNPKGYQLEVAINKYMIEKNKKCFWTNSSIFNPHKVTKYGFVEGMRRDLKMEKEIISYIGIMQYLQQMFLFAREEIS